MEVMASARETPNVDSALAHTLPYNHRETESTIDIFYYPSTTMITACPRPCLPLRSLPDPGSECTIVFQPDLRVNQAHAERSYEEEDRPSSSGQRRFGDAQDHSTREPAAPLRRRVQGRW